MTKPVASTSSPNFPTSLNIAPLHFDGDKAAGSEEQGQWITRYGIAGRVWEAVPYLMQYLNPPGHLQDFTFEPPCSIFTRKGCLNPASPPRILELGSGNGHLCLHHLALLLPPGSQLVLTDLDEVTPLLAQNTKLAIEDGRVPDEVQLLVQSLPWGSREHIDKLRHELGEESFTHIICSDLVYFTDLLEPLLKTLLWLTESTADTPEQSISTTEVIFGYKIRAIHKEQAFWESLGAFFDLEAVFRDLPEQALNSDDGQSGRASSPYEEDRLLIMLAKRKRGSLQIYAPDEGNVLLRPLMDHKDDQFESMLMLRSVKDY